MLKSNQVLFMERLKKYVVNCVMREDGETLQENLQYTVENMQACISGYNKFLPAREKINVLSVPGLRQYIVTCGGFFDYCEYKQIEVLAGFYCETDEEKQKYIAKYEKLLEKRGYDFINDFFASIILKGLKTILQDNKISLPAENKKYYLFTKEFLHENRR